ncbi:MAG: tetratricopeptide repeat protein [Lysobacterales bacterium]
MTDPRWEKMWSLFHEISALPEQEQSDALRIQCGDDTAMAQELVELLAANADSSPLDKPPAMLFDLAVGLEGREVGAWKLERELGRGGGGAVYLAQRDDGAYQQQVAIKFMARHRDEHARRSFQAERELLARLDHANIARLIDAGETNDGIPFLVMEYVQGQSLNAWCEEQQPTISHRLRLFIKICQAVQFAHQHLIVHRDLKPANVMVTVDGDPKLLDFGIARPPDASDSHPQTLDAMTPDYASPEQVLGQSVTTASDIYSLGVLLYQLLCGQRPYALAGTSREQAIDAICNRPVAAPSTHSNSVQRAKIAGDLDAIVAMAMARKPAQRYGTPQDMASDIRRHLTHHPVLARGPQRTYQLGRFIRRHRLSVAATLLVTIALTGLSGSLFFQGRQLSAALGNAEQQTRRSRTAFQFLADLLLQADPETNQGKPITVTQVLDQGAEQLVNRFQSEPVLKSELSGTVAEIYLHLGELDSAEQFFRQALVADGESTTALGGLALVAGARGNPQEGEALQRRVIQQLVRENNPAKLAEARLRLAALLQDQSRLEEADTEMTAALAVPLIDPVAAARSRIRYGSLRWAQGNTGLAAEQYQLALATFSVELGSQHHETARAHYALGAARHSQGNYQEAEDHYQQALEIRESIYGPHHPLVARVFEALGGLLYDAGRSAESLPISQQALELQQAIHGPDAPRTTRALNHLALAQHDLGEFQIAIDNQRRSLAINIENYGPEHALVAVNSNNLGLIYLDQGRPSEAMQSFQDGLKIHQKIYATDHAALAYSAHFIGRTHLQLGKLDDALRWLNQAVAAREKLRDGYHPQLADSLVWRSLLNLLEHQLTTAAADAERALTIRKKNLLKSDWRLAEAQTIAGSLRLLLDRQDEIGRSVALSLLDEGLQRLEQSRGGRDWRVIGIRKRWRSAICQAHPPGLLEPPDNHPLCTVE